MDVNVLFKDHTQDSDQPYSCVIQYVLFPPYLQSCEPERSEESVLDWASLGKAGRKFNMVTEVWAEPQFGCLTDLKTELKYMEGLQYDQIPDAVSSKANIRKYLKELKNTQRKYEQAD